MSRPGLNSHYKDLTNKVAGLWTPAHSLKGWEVPEVATARPDQAPSGNGIEGGRFAIIWNQLLDIVHSDQTFGHIKLHLNKKFKRIQLCHIIVSLTEKIHDRLIIGKNELFRDIRNARLKDLQVAAKPDAMKNRMANLFEKTNLIKMLPNLLLDVETFINKANQFSELRTTSNPSLCQFKYLSDFYERVSVLAASSADCERMFSLMNKIHSDDRSSLNTETVSNIMMVMFNGPPPSLVDPEKLAAAIFRSKGFRKSRASRKPTLTRGVKRMIRKTEALYRGILFDRKSSSQDLAPKASQ